MFLIQPTALSILSYPSYCASRWASFPGIVTNEWLWTVCLWLPINPVTVSANWVRQNLCQRCGNYEDSIIFTVLETATFLEIFLAPLHKNLNKRWQTKGWLETLNTYVATTIYILFDSLTKDHIQYYYYCCCCFLIWLSQWLHTGTVVNLLIVC